MNVTRRVVVFTLILFGLYGLVVAYILWRFGWRTLSRAKGASKPTSA